MTATICISPESISCFDAVAHDLLGPTDRLGDGRVGTAAVLLELFDDRLGDVIDDQPGRRCGAMLVLFAGWSSARP